MMNDKGRSIIEKYVIPILKVSLRVTDLPVESLISVPSKKALKKLIKKGLVNINGRRAQTGDYIVGGDCLTIIDEEGRGAPQIDLSLKVIYEDNYLAVIDKPAGVIVSGNRHRTIQHALSFTLVASPFQDRLSQARPVHRLDGPTSGLLLIAKTGIVLMALQKQFADRTIQKGYLAVTLGDMPENGEVHFDVDDKEAHTTFAILVRMPSEKCGFINLIHLRPSTGRRHQLRKHLAQIGFPIVGDREYGYEGEVLRGKGLYLHAHFLKFEHPITKELICLKSTLPKKFLKLFPMEQHLDMGTASNFH